MSINDILFRADLQAVRDRWQRRIEVKDSGCWEWFGHRGWCGYGVMGVGSSTFKVHRLAWVLARGGIPDGLLVLHHCDNPPCCNPAHLFLGTMQDNVDDMVRKGRQGGNKMQGTAHVGAVLTDDAVRAIRSDARFHRVIAEEYGVARSTVGRIKSGHKWKHLL